MPASSESCTSRRRRCRHAASRPPAPKKFKPALMLGALLAVMKTTSFELSSGYKINDQRTVLQPSPPLRGLFCPES